MKRLGIKCEASESDKNKKCECNAQNVCTLVNLSNTPVTTTPKSSITSPNTCTNVYSPVCGSDNNTYQNRCELDRAKVSFKYTGVCTTTTTQNLPQPGRCFTNSDCL